MRFKYKLCLGGLAVLTLCLHVEPVNAANVNWDVAGPADWSEDANWDPPVAPEIDFDDSAVIANGGTAQVTSAVSDVIGLNLSNGVVEISAGGSLTVLEGASIGRNGTLRLSGDGKFDAESLGGSGTVELIGSSAGLTVEGDYSVGSLQFGISSSGSAEISVGGAATLRGTIHPVFDDDVQVAFGDSWSFLKAESITGEAVAMPAGGSSLARGLALQVSADNGTASVSVTNVPVLTIDRVTGGATIANVVGQPIALTAYSVGSLSGLLAPESWTSLKSTGGDDWTEANPRAQRLAELNLSGETTLDVGGTIDLGNAYNASQGANPREEDVTFEYLRADGSVATGIVEYNGPANDLVLRVDPETGQADISHRSSFIDPFDVTFYSILSDSGSLSVEGWNSLADNGLAGEGWTIANPRDVALGELNLSDSHVFQNGTIIGLGSIFTPGSDQDLTFEFGTVDGRVNVGTVEYGTLEVAVAGDDCNGDGTVDVLDADCTADIESFLTANGLIAGDLDGNGSVEFADFLRLSGNFGQSATYTQGDIDKNGTVEFGDFLTLSTNFGQTSETSAVPEPTALWMLGLAAGMFLVARRRPV